MTNFLPITLILLWCLKFNIIYSSKLLKPGALVAPTNKVILNEDSVTIKYSLDSIFDLSTNYRTLHSRLDMLNGQLLAFTSKVHMSPDVKKIIELQRLTVSRLVSQVEAISIKLPEDDTSARKHAHSKRIKRGLFNFIGIISKELFGTAQANDVELLGKRLTLLEENTKTINRILAYKTTHEEELKASLNSVIYRINNITDAMTDLAYNHNILPKVAYFQAVIQILTNDISDYISVTQHALASLVDAALNRVTSTLLPVDHLRKAIISAQKQFKLKPLFSLNEIEFYYPLLEATLTQSSIMIHIPCYSIASFTAWQIIPFPFILNDTLLTVSKTADIVIISNDLKLVAMTSLEELNQCRMSYLHLYVCPAYMFTFQSSTLPSCEFSLTQAEDSNTESISACTYVRVPRRVYHAHIITTHFFFFPDETQVSLHCYEKAEVFLARGYYQTQDYCEVRTVSISTLPSRHHLALVSNLSARFTPAEVTFIANTSLFQIDSVEYSHLDVLNSSTIKEIVVSSLPSYMSMEFLYPSMFLPVFIIIIIVLCLLYALRRLSLRVDVLARKPKNKGTNTGRH